MVNGIHKGLAHRLATTCGYHYQCSIFQQWDQRISYLIAQPICKTTFVVGCRERTIVVEGYGGKPIPVQLAYKTLAGHAVMLPQRGVVSTSNAQFAQHRHIECLLYRQDMVGQLEIVQVVEHTTVSWHTGFSGVNATSLAQVVDKTECLQQHIDGRCGGLQLGFNKDSRYTLGQATNGFISQIAFNGCY